MVPWAHRGSHQPLCEEEPEMRSTVPPFGLLHGALKIKSTEFPYQSVCPAAFKQIFFVFLWSQLKKNQHHCKTLYVLIPLSIYPSTICLVYHLPTYLSIIYLINTVYHLYLTGGIVYSLSCVKPFCDPMDCSPPGSSVHGISQARILEWIVFPSPGDLSDHLSAYLSIIYLICLVSPSYLSVYYCCRLFTKSCPTLFWSHGL